jgi:uroporphyrinogen decarboxylase
MEKLSTVVARYLNAQIAAGAQVVQLFDSWVGALSPTDYDAYVAPHVRSIFSAVHGAPTIHFGAATAGLLERLADAGGDIISIDARQLLDEAWQRVGFERGIQGNLDATRLLAGWEATEAGARDVLRRAGGRPGHIFNLGHGVLPQSDPDLVRRLVDFVHAETAR